MLGSVEVGEGDEAVGHDSMISRGIVARMVCGAGFGGTHISGVRCGVPWVWLRVEGDRDKADPSAALRMALGWYS